MLGSVSGLLVQVSSADVRYAFSFFFKPLCVFVSTDEFPKAHILLLSIVSPL